MATRCRGYHSPRILDIVPPEAEPQDVVPPKAEPATLCHVDLDVVCSP